MGIKRRLCVPSFPDFFKQGPLRTPLCEMQHFTAERLPGRLAACLFWLSPCCRAVSPRPKSHPPKLLVDSRACRCPLLVGVLGAPSQGLGLAWPASLQGCGMGEGERRCLLSLQLCPPDPDPRPGLGTRERGWQDTDSAPPSVPVPIHPSVHPSIPLSIHPFTNSMFMKYL